MLAVGILVKSHCTHEAKTAEYSFAHLAPLASICMLITMHDSLTEDDSHQAQGVGDNALP